LPVFKWGFVKSLTHNRFFTINALFFNALDIFCSAQKDCRNLKKFFTINNARVAELADALDLGL